MSDKAMMGALFAAMILPLVGLMVHHVIGERRARRRRARQFLVDMTGYAVDRLSPASAVAIVSEALDNGLLTKGEAMQILDRPRPDAIQVIGRWVS